MLALPGAMRPLLILSLLAFTGCDNSETSEGVRHAYMDRHGDAFVYEGTTHEHVLAVIKSVLADRGYEVSPGSEPLSWKTNARPGTYGWTHEYSIHITDMRWRKGFFVELLDIGRSKDGQVSSDRDDKLEWEVIQRADPDRAAQIMATANERADKVPPRVHRDR